MKSYVVLVLVPSIVILGQTKISDGRLWSTAREDFLFIGGPCNFGIHSPNSCGMGQLTSDDLEWGFNGGSEDSRPFKDHTSEANGRGYYASVTGVRPGQVGRVEGIRLQMGSYCVDFYLRGSGDRRTQLNVYRVSRNGGKLGNAVFQRGGDFDDDWQLIKIQGASIPDGGRFMFEAVLGERGSVIAIDDMLTRQCGDHTGAGPATSPNIGRTLWTTPDEDNLFVGGFCSFDSNVPKTCGFKQQKGDDLDWGYQAGRDEAESYPDHTSGLEGRGHYISVRSERSGKVARVLSYRLKQGSYCMDFYLRGAGDRTTQLNVYRATRSGDKLAGPVYQHTAQVPYEWKKINVFEANIVSGDRFMFEAVLGVRGDIAVDDILIRQCDRPTGVRDPTDNSAPIDDGSLVKELKCDFEQSKPMCNLVQGQNGVLDDMDWLKRQGPTTTWNTGPNSDASGNGHYAYVEAGSRERSYTGKVSCLLTPPLSGGKYCVNFSLNMNGQGGEMGTFNVIKINKDGSKADSPLFTQRGEIPGLKENWKDISLEQITVGNFEAVMFEAVIGSGSHSDIALDNVDVSLCEQAEGNVSPDKDKPEVEAELESWLREDVTRRAAAEARRQENERWRVQRSEETRVQWISRLKERAVQNNDRCY